MSRGKSKTLFRTTAMKVHKKNLPHTVMRGGFRM